MFEISIDFNPDYLIKQLNLDATKLQDNLQRVVQGAGNLVRNTAILNISRGARKGRIYRRGRRGFHQASSVGEYRKTDTGRLVSSIRANSGHNKTMSWVGSDLIYSKFLELGTNRMGPRPWLRRSLEANNAKIKELVDEAIKRSLK